MSRWRVLALCVVAAIALPLRAAPAPERKVPKTLLQERLQAARKVYDQTRMRVRGGDGRPTDLFGWSERILKAELPLCETEEARVAAYKANVERTREVERILKGLERTGNVLLSDANAATYYRVEAEILYFKATGKEAPKKEEKKAP